MTHNKIRNVGIIFEALNKAVTTAVSNSDVNKASEVYNVIKKYFLNKNSYIAEVYNNVFSPVLYCEASNHYFATRFLENVLKENSKLNESRLNKEINNLLKEIDTCTNINRKEIFSQKLSNYKLFASLKCLHEHVNNIRKLNPREVVSCEEIVSKHLTEGKIKKSIKEAENAFNFIGREEEIEDQGIAMTIAVQKFRERYNSSLTEQQNDFLTKYLTSESNVSFGRYCEKKVKNLLTTINVKRNFIKESKDSDELLEKLQLVESKLQRIIRERNIKSDDVVTILTSLQLEDILKLYK